MIYATEGLWSTGKGLTQKQREARASDPGLADFLDHIDGGPLALQGYIVANEDVFGPYEEVALEVTRVPKTARATVVKCDSRFAERVVVYNT